MKLPKMIQEHNLVEYGSFSHYPDFSSSQSQIVQAAELGQGRWPLTGGALIAATSCINNIAFFTLCDKDCEPLKLQMINSCVTTGVMSVAALSSWIAWFRGRRQPQVQDQNI
jgi:hypothetical protein